MFVVLIKKISFVDATPSAVASFSDARCTAGGVCPNDSLVFTCGVNNAYALRILLPSGIQEIISLGDSANNVVLSVGFTADTLVITQVDDSTRNISLTLSIDLSVEWWSDHM